MATTIQTYLPSKVRNTEVSGMKQNTKMVSKGIHDECTGSGKKCATTPSDCSTTITSTQEQPLSHTQVLLRQRKYIHPHIDGVRVHGRLLPVIIALALWLANDPVCLCVCVFVCSCVCVRVWWCVYREHVCANTLKQKAHSSRVHCLLMMAARQSSI